jgi:hypothetical protein
MSAPLEADLLHRRSSAENYFAYQDTTALSICEVAFLP